MLAVNAEGVSKNFGPAPAIRDAGLAIEPGTLAGLIGPDGAGKSTFLRLLIGLLRPDRGRVEVAGFDVARHPFEVKARIGYMPQHFSLYGDLTVAENMKFFADYYGVQGPTFAERKAELLRFSALGPFESRLARNLSGGMQKKLALACNLFHTPALLLLDEPTTGVDPVSRRELWALLGQLHDRGVTILMTTPYMDEAARCERVAFIDTGRILAYDSPAGLIRRVTDEIAELVAPQPAAINALKARPGIKSVQAFGNAIHILYDRSAADLESIRRALDAAAIPVESLATIPPSFEDVFLALTRRTSP
jgi:ABC-2 type transport system ATP-binding protein